MAKKKKDILIPRIGRTVWKKLNPGDDDIDWEIDQLPGNYSEYISSYLDMEVIDPAEDQKIKVVSLTKDYLSWLDQNQRKDSDTARQAYMKNIDDEQTEQLLKRSHMNKDRYLMALPMVIRFAPAINGTLQSEYRLTEKLCVKLEKDIARLYADSKIIVPGTVCKAVDIAGVNAENWFHLVFDENEPHPDWIDSTQDYESPFLPFAILYIPFIMEHTCHKAVFTYDEFTNSDEFHMDGYDVSDTEGFEQVLDDMSELLNDSDIFEDASITVIGDVPPHYDAYPHERFWLHRVYEEFVEGMEDIMKEEIGGFELGHPKEKFRA